MVPVRGGGASMVTWTHGVWSAKFWHFMYCELGIVYFKANMERVCISEFKLLTHT